jgi:hypothetical protein
VPIRFNRLLLCILVSGCARTVKISFPPESVIHPTFDKSYTIWKGERSGILADRGSHFAKYRNILANTRDLIIGED